LSIKKRNNAITLWFQSESKWKCQSNQWWARKNIYKTVDFKANGFSGWQNPEV